MKRNIFLRIAALLMVSCMFSLCTVTAAVPGTLSKYSRFGTGGAQIRAGIFRVALKRGDGWVDITSDEFAVGSANAFVVDLFAELKELDQDTQEHVGPESVGPTGDVWKADTGAGETAIIAPGTGGEMKISVINFSEVGVQIEIAINTALMNNDPGIYIEWEQGKDTGVWSTSLPTLDTSDSILAPRMATEKEYTLKWRWQYERGTVTQAAAGNFARIMTEDPTDTGLGIGAVSADIEYKIPFNISATQRD